MTITPKTTQAAQADKELPGSAAEVRSLINALQVITLTPHIRAYLIANDPMALRQALAALSAYVPVVTTEQPYPEQPYQESCECSGGHEPDCIYR